MQQKKEPYYFEETQRLTNWLLWILAIGVLILMLSILIYQIVTGNLVGDQPAPNAVLVGFIVFICLPSLFLLWYAKLAIRINAHAIYYGWNLLTDELNKIEWTDIQSCEIITYPFVGYGYRLTKNYGIVYNTKGNKGLLLTKKSGEKILLGSLKINELRDTLLQLNLYRNH